MIQRITLPVILISQETFVFNVFIDSSREMIISNILEYYPNWYRSQVQVYIHLTGPERFILMDSDSIPLSYYVNFKDLEHLKDIRILSVSNMFSVKGNDEESSLKKKFALSQSYYMDKDILLSSFHQLGFKSLQVSDLETIIKSLYNKQNKDSADSDSDSDNEVDNEVDISYKSNIKPVEYLFQDDVSLNVLVSKVYSFVEFQRVQKIQGPVKNFIDLTKLYNSIILSLDVPFVALNGKYTEDKVPIFKLHESTSDLPESLVKSWMINEHKKEASYKQIDGVTIMISFDLPEEVEHKFPFFLMLSINETGLLTCVFDLEARNVSGGVIAKSLKGYIKEIPYMEITSKINEIIERWNFFNIFKSQVQRNLDVFDDFKIKKMSIHYITNKRINKKEWDRFMRKKGVIKSLETLLTLNNTEGDLVSLNYLNRPMGISPLIINITDNMYQYNSSVIKIMKGENEVQMYIVFLLIQGITYKNVSLLKDDYTKQMLTFDTKAKRLKRLGIEIDSTNCQKNSMPIVSDTQQVVETLPGRPRAYDLYFNGHRYICDDPKVPYPGFTNKGIVCCYKEYQKNKENYKNIMGFTDELVQPSNKQIVLKDSNGGTFTTFAIKKLGENGGYYYIDSSDELVRVENEELIEELDKEDSWLPETFLEDLLIIPQKGDCKNPPDFSKPDVDKCNEYETHPYFGYTLNSVPCCFKTPPVSKTMKKRLTKSRLGNKHLLRKTIILPPNREGMFVKDSMLDVFFSMKGNYVRRGFSQSNQNLLYILLDVLYEENTRTDILNLVKLRDSLQVFTKLDIYRELNNGLLASEYSYEYYLHYIQAIDNDLDIRLVLDLFSRYLRCNIIIVDIKHAQIVCTPNVPKDSSNTYSIVLLRHTEETKRVHYELLVLKTEYDSYIRFDMDHILIKTLLEYYKESCKREYNPPNGYQEMYTFKDILSRIGKERVKGQVKNGLGQTFMIVLTNDELVPIEPRSIITHLTLVNTLPITTYEETRDYINTLRDGYGFDRYFIVAQLKFKGIIGVLTSFGVSIPIKVIDKEIPNLPVYTVDTHDLFSLPVRSIKNTFSQLYTLDDIKGLVGLENIRGKFINAFNQIYMLVIKNSEQRYGGLVHIEPILSRELSVPILNFDLIKSKYTSDKILKQVESLGRNGLDRYTIIGQIVKNQYTIGLLTVFGTILPIIPQLPIDNLPISPWNWYYNEEDKYIYDKKDDSIFVDERIEFYNTYQNLHRDVVKIKKKLGPLLFDHIDMFKEIIKSTETDTLDKVIKVKGLLEPFWRHESMEWGGVSLEVSEFIKDEIAKEIVLDNINMTLFYSMIDDPLVEDTKTYRLLTLMDIKSYLNQFKKTLSSELVI